MCYEWRKIENNRYVLVYDNVPVGEEVLLENIVAMVSLLVDGKWEWVLHSTNEFGKNKTKMGAMGAVNQKLTDI